MILFFLYLAVLTYFLFFSEKYGRTAEREFSYNLTPFLEIRRFWNYREFLGLKAVFINLAGNVLAFVPFGAILPVISRRMRGFFRVMLLGFSFSLLVECTQLVTRVGTFDVDDLMLNTLGAVLGYLFFALCDRIRRHKEERLWHRVRPLRDGRIYMADLACWVFMAKKKCIHFPNAAIPEKGSPPRCWGAFLWSFLSR